LAVKLSLIKPKKINQKQFTNEIQRKLLLSLGFMLMTIIQMLWFQFNNISLIVGSLYNAITIIIVLTLLPIVTVTFYFFLILFIKIKRAEGKC
jgi:uncharacterized membrane protein